MKQGLCSAGGKDQVGERFAGGKDQVGERNLSSKESWKKTKLLLWI